MGTHWCRPRSAFAAIIKFVSGVFVFYLPKTVKFGQVSGPPAGGAQRKTAALARGRFETPARGKD
jgi:hypothetical protein